VLAGFHAKLRQFFLDLVIDQSIESYPACQIDAEGRVAAEIVRACQALLPVSDTGEAYQ